MGVPCYFQTNDMEKAETAVADKDSYGFAEATDGESVILAAREAREIHWQQGRRVFLKCRGAQLKSGSKAEPMPELDARSLATFKMSSKIFEANQTKKLGCYAANPPRIRSARFARSCSVQMRSVSPAAIAASNPGRSGSGLLVQEALAALLGLRVAMRAVVVRPRKAEES
jgi:hypothetical protein